MKIKKISHCCLVIENTAVGKLLDGLGIAHAVVDGRGKTTVGTGDDVLALPVAGPWCRLSDALHYAIKMKPRAAFPIHEAKA